MEIKQAKTYEEQVAIIEGKGFIIEDKEACVDFLKEANYYRLSAYFLPFRKKDGTYIPNVSFNRVQRIYDFDSRVRALLFQTIEEIEFFLRTQLAYYSGHKFGALGYLKDSNFSNKHDTEKFHKKVNTCIKENQQTLVVKHHNEMYDGKFPIWVIVEFFSIGMLSYFYGDLITEDQKALSKEMYGTSPACLKSWLRCITDLRNRCAHYSRIYYWSFPALPKMPNDCACIADRKLFTQIMMLKFLYPNADKWNTTVVIGIKALIEEFEHDIALKHIGFPQDWEVQLINKNVLVQ